MGPAEVLRDLSEAFRDSLISLYSSSRLTFMVELGHFDFLINQLVDFFPTKTSQFIISVPL